jgi:hypothetical protein
VISVVSEFSWLHGTRSFINCLSYTVIYFLWLFVTPKAVLDYMGIEADWKDFFERNDRSSAFQLRRMELTQF